MNHGQTLYRLKERGGLSVKEMLAVINDVPYEYFGNMSIWHAIAALNQILRENQLK